MAESPNKYSLYAGREMQGTAVNWGQIAADVSGTLGEIAKDRIARRDKIRQDTNDALEQLSKVELGAAADMNSLIIDASAFSKNTVSNAYDMVRQGLMDPKDFQLLMQKQKDGYSQMSLYAKTYSEKYKQALERVNNGQAAGIEEAMRMTGLKFGNLKNKKLWSDPNTGQLVLVDMEERIDANGNGTGEFYIPNYEGNEDKFLTPVNALNMSSYEQQSLNLSEDAQKYVVGNLGSVVIDTMTKYTTLGGGNEITSETNFRQLFTSIGGMKDENGKQLTFEQWLKSQAQGLMGTDQQKAEYLFQAGRIEFINGERPAGNIDESKVYYTVNSQGEPVYELTEAQREDALRIGEIAINTQLDYEIEKQRGLSGQQVRAKTSVEIGQDERNKQRSKMYGFAVDLVSGDLNAASAASTTLAQIYNKNRGEGAPEMIVAPRRGVNDDGQLVWTIEFEDGPVEISAISADGTTPKTTEQIVDEIYDFMNPYNDDVSIGKTNWRGNYGTINEESAEGVVQFKTIPDIDFQSDVNIDGEAQTPTEYLKSVLDYDLDNYRNATGDQIEKAVKNLISNIMPDVMLRNIPVTVTASTADNNANFTDTEGLYGIENATYEDGYILLNFGDPTDKRYNYVISGTTDMNVDQLYKEIEKAMRKARTQYNKNEDKPL